MSSVVHAAFHSKRQDKPSPTRATEQEAVAITHDLVPQEHDQGDLEADFLFFPGLRLPAPEPVFCSPPPVSCRVQSPEEGAAAPGLHGNLSPESVEAAALQALRCSAPLQHVWCPPRHCEGNLV